MRNLKLEHCEWFQNFDHLTGLKKICLDADSQKIYGINSDGNLACYDGGSHDTTIVCWNVIPDDTINVVGIEYVIENNSVCIALSAGDLVAVNVDDGSTECVGSVSSGLQGMFWSSDQESLVLTTGENTIILMQRTFDPICEKDMNPKEYGSGKAVNVGWGSKTTQFHGSEGKAAAKARADTVAELSSMDDRKPRVTWRTDGEYFALSSVDPEKNFRVVRIWNSNAELVHTSEVINGLEHLLSWKPNGNLIASSVQRYGKHEVLFFEKNGLAHGSFTLPFPASQFQVRDLTWSADSKILLVWGTFENMQYVMLWTVNNYHWYLKQTLKFPMESKTLQTVAWDPQVATKLHLVFEDGFCAIYNWKWIVNSSISGEVAVVDGKSLLVTPFNTCVIPPPMSAYTINYEDFVNEVNFDHDSRVFAYLSGAQLVCSQRHASSKLSGLNLNDKVKIVSHTGSRHREVNQLPETSCAIAIPADSAGLRHFSFLKSGLLTTEFTDGNNGHRIVLSDLHGLSKSVLQVLDGPVVVSCATHNGDIVALHLSDRSVLKYSEDLKSLSKWTTVAGKELILPQICSEIKLCEVDNELKLFGLSLNGQLICNETVLLKNCSSFLIHENKFLIFTLTTSTLNCWALSSEVSDKLSSVAFDEKQEEKPTEPGSKLIVSTKSGGVIVQTPRGNLETVYPRKLLWNAVVSMLEEKDYLMAFEIMRKNRMNLNLLYDQCPVRFMEDLPLIIGKLGEDHIEYLNLFISDLSNEAMSPPGSKIVRKLPVGSKITVVCQELRKVMESMDSIKFLPPILASLVKEGQVGEALLRIKQLSEESLQNEALKFIFYMIDVNALCDEALGTYDLDIVLMVSGKSQKDPREYSQFLGEIRAYSPENYRKYKIDVHLKRYVKALSSISKCAGDDYFNEALALIEQRKLYREALKIYSGEAEVKILWKKFADYLLSKRYYGEAALGYKRAKDAANAIKSYQLAGNWNAAIVASSSLNNPSQTAALCSTLIDSLKSQGKFVEASFLAKEYLKDTILSYQVLVDGREWDHAHRALSELNDSYSVDFTTKVSEHFESVLETVEFNEINLRKYVERLIEVREENARKSKECFEYDAIPDNVSEISGVPSSARLSGSLASGSLGTRKTTRSSKKQLKGYSMKEGSATEDLALVSAVKDIILTVNKLQDEVALLIRHMCECGLEAEAVQLQQKFEGLIVLVERQIPLVWSTKDAATSTTEDVILSSLQPEELISDPKLRQAPEFRKVNWKFVFAEKV